MTALLIKLFIKNPADTANPRVRTSYGFLGGTVGIVCNLLLFAAKLIIGLISGSISIVADAVNNLSDVGASGVTLFGFKISSKPADAEHPFGHGRMEYISTLLVAMIIMALGGQLVYSSVLKIIHPETPEFSYLSLAILAGALLLKVWLSVFCKKLSRIIDSQVLFAAGADALNDVYTTGATMLSIIAVKLLPFSIDGYIGLLVALFVLYSGFKIVRDTISTLLGEPPTPELVHKIKKELLNNSYVSAVHDLIIHNYGPGRTFASVHVEVPADADIMAVHEIIDQTELKILNELGVLITIHTDPIANNNEETNALQKEITGIIKDIDPNMTIHDFRIIDGSLRIVIMFDVVVPVGFKKSEKELTEQIQKRVKTLNPLYHCVVTMDYDYGG